jgi:hypothetical protein
MPESYVAFTISATASLRAEAINAGESPIIVATALKVTQRQPSESLQWFGGERYAGDT